MEKEKKALLFLNGEVGSRLPPLLDYHGIFAIDGGYQKIKDRIAIDAIIGDFDSLKVDNNQKITKIHTPNQNYTDFEKALIYLIKEGFSAADIYHASGEEGDHYLGNLSIAMQYHHKIKLNFFDDRQNYYYVNQTLNLNGVKDKIISLFPFPKAILSSQGLKWELNQHHLEIGKQLGLRNQAIKNDVTIMHHQGGYFIYIGR
ncbi:MAG: thiamine diphosphokinase [Alphaproteobacteria bacterium]